MAQLTFNPTVGDGFCEGGAGGESLWQATHDQAAADTTTDTATTVQLGVDRLSSTRYFIKRGFFPFDTSSIPDDATITSATLQLYATINTNSDNDGNNYLAICETFQAGTSELVDADYEDCGSDNGTGGRAKETPIEEGSAQLSLNSISTSQYNTLTFNATGLAWISKTGVTQIGVREGHDLTDNAPDDNSKVTVSAVEESGSKDPILTVNYTEASSNVDLQGFFNI